MKITQVAQSVKTQQVQKKGRKTDAAPVKQSADKVEISTEAKKLSQSNKVSATAAQSIKNAPEVREDKIAEVRERIAEDFYNQKNITTLLADEILKDFGI